MNKSVTQIDETTNIDNRKQQRNLARFHAEAAAASVEDAAVGYQAPSVIAVGANAQSVSILATLVNLCLALVSFKAPSIIEKIGVTKRGSVVLGLSNIFTWIPLVIVFLLVHFQIAPAWVAILWLVNILPGMLLSFQKDNWLSDSVPEQMMGKYLGKRLAIKSGFYLAAFFSFGYLMDSMGDNNLISFGLVFLIATIATLTYSFIFSKMYDPQKPEVHKEKTPQVKFGLKDYLLDLKKKKLDKFVVFTGLINVSIGLSAPFYAVYMLQEQNFSYMSYTLIIAVEFVARVISGPFWGKFADKQGNIQVLKIVSRIVPVLPICWLFSSNIAYLAMIQIMSGICWGAFDLSTQSYLYKVAPQKNKLHYIVYTRSLMLFAVAMGGLAGSFLIKDIFEVFGSKLLTVFMISGFLRAAIVMFLMPKLIDLAVKYWTWQPSHLNLVLTKKAANKHGLFYHVPEEEEDQTPSNVIEGVVTHKRNPAMEQRLMEASAAKKQLELLTETVQTGAKRNWALAAMAKAQAAKIESILEPEMKTPSLDPEEQAHLKKVAEKEPLLANAARRNWVIREQISRVTPEPEPTLEISSSRRPWFGDDEIMENYQTARVTAMAPAKGREATLTVGKTNTPGRNGLFHDDEGWARYREQSLQTVIREKKAYQAASHTKKPKQVSSYPWR
jgi:MFS family permease